MNSFSTITGNLAAEATSPEIERLLSHWNALHSSLNRLPTYAEFNINDFPECVDNMMVLLPHGDDYFYMFYGAAIAKEVGFDMTGKCLSEFDEPVRVKLKSYYNRCIETEKPQFSIQGAEYTASPRTWERLMLPLAGFSKDELLLVTYNSPRQFKQDLLDAILQASTNGILAVTPVYGDDDRIFDGVVVAANKAIEAVVGLTSDDLLGVRLLETFPGLSDNGAWERYRTVFETGISDQFELCFDVSGMEAIFQVGVAAFSGGVTITFADVGDLVRANQSLEQQRADMMLANHALEAKTKELATLAEALEANRTTLHLEMKRREELEEELRTIANTDELTGIPNRRGFSDQAKQQLKRAERYNREVSVVVLDVDRFKTFNDTYGHAIGDHVLRIVGRRISECVREDIDVFGRVGGEEFALLLPETGRDGAYEVAERLRQKIEESFIGIKGDLVRVTASFGIASWTGFGESLQGVLHRADAALYSAKRLGRNRVEVDMPTMEFDDEIMAIERDE